ncbi:MAG: hypothetical protein JJE47_11845 [Acidimicrobiia bacterium]|nr:hypothetical protein [Acidimicrobiia bacterium]
MRRLRETWRGWLGVALALSLAAASIIADFQLQRTVQRVYTAALDDAGQGRTTLQNIDELIGRTLAAIEFSILAADQTGSVVLDPQARRQLTVQVNTITASAEFGLSETLDRTIHLDARLDTLGLLSGRPPDRLITPDVISLRGTIVEAANTATRLLSEDTPLDSDQIDSMRGRLEGAKDLESDIDSRLGDVTEVLEQVRSTIRWRIHLLVTLALITLGWFGYQSWRSVVAKRPERTTIDPD